MMVPPSVLANALYDGQKSAGTLGLAFAAAYPFVEQGFDIRVASHAACFPN